MIESESATGVTEHDATLNAEINPNGLYTGYWFQIDTNSSYNFEQPSCPFEFPGYAQCEAIRAGEPLPAGLVEPQPKYIPAGSSDQSVSVDLESIRATLQSATTYHYRVIASNGGNPVVGPDQTFTTPGPQPTPPSIESESVSHLTPTDATLNAEINPNGLYTGYWFQIDTNSSYNFEQPSCPFEFPGYAQCEAIRAGEPLPAGLVEPQPKYIPAGSSDQSVSVDLESIRATLQSATTYHYRVIASNGGNPVVGPDQTFTTPGPQPTPPSIESESVSHLTPTDATLEAQINTEGLETTYEFQLVRHLCPPGTEPLGCKAMIQRVPLPSGRLLGSFVGQSVGLDLNSAGVTLSPGVEYSYSVTAISAEGTTEGHPQNFTTPKDGAQPLNTTTVPGPQPATGAAQNAGQGTVTPGATNPVGHVTPSPKMTVLTNAQKRTTALRACNRKPRKQRASCVKQAHKKYGTKASKAKKR